MVQEEAGSQLALDLIGRIVFSTREVVGHIQEEADVEEVAERHPRTRHRTTIVLGDMVRARRPLLRQDHTTTAMAALMNTVTLMGRVPPMQALVVRITACQTMVRVREIIKVRIKN